MKDIDDLIESASRLPMPDGVADNGRRASHTELADRLDELMLAEPGIDVMVPPGKRSMMRENHRNLTRYMDTNLELFEPRNFVGTVIWAMKTYRSHGFAVAYWQAMLPHLLGLLEATSTPRSEHVTTYYRWILDNLDTLAALSEPDA